MDIGGGYQKLLSAYKELDEVNTQVVNFTKNEFPEVSTLIAWGAVTYGSYVQGRSDFDYIIVLKDSVTVQQIQEKLRYKLPKYTSMSPDDLEIMVADYEALERGDVEVIRPEGVYTLTEVDIYIISHFGKILFGEEKALKLFPQRQLADFYPQVVKKVRQKLKDELYKNYTVEDDPINFIERNIDNVMLMYRVLFTHLNGEVWGKVESVDWICARLTNTNSRNLRKLGQIVKKIYLRTGGFQIDEDTFGELVHDSVKEFLRLTKI